MQVHVLIHVTWDLRDEKYVYEYSRRMAQAINIIIYLRHLTYLYPLQIFRNFQFRKNIANYAHNTIRIENFNRKCWSSSSLLRGNRINEKLLRAVDIR